MPDTTGPYTPDDRVALVHTDDERTQLKPGDQGTVCHIDSAGTIHVSWDNGSSLGIVPGSGDEIRRLDDPAGPLLVPPSAELTAFVHQTAQRAASITTTATPHHPDTHP